MFTCRYFVNAKNEKIAVGKGQKTFNNPFRIKKYNFILGNKIYEQLLINVLNKDITMFEVNIINQMKMKTRSTFY